MALAEEALGSSKHADMFRFNPGRQQTTVPDYNPYTIRRCQTCDIAKGKGKLARQTPADNQTCEACMLFHSMKDKATNEDTIRGRSKSARKSLETWTKGNLPHAKAGKFDARRFEVVTQDGLPIYINNGFYTETISKYQDDPLYPLKLEYAKRAHNLLPLAKHVRTEGGTDHPKNVFKVYETEDECYRVEMKVVPRTDGNYLHILRIYEK